MDPNQQPIRLPNAQEPETPAPETSDVPYWEEVPSEPAPVPLEQPETNTYPLGLYRRGIPLKTALIVLAFALPLLGLWLWLAALLARL